MRTFVSALQEQAAKYKSKKAFTFLTDGEEPGPSVTFGELHDRARAVATTLRRSLGVGDRAILLYPPGLEFIEGFLGCLYAGIVGVPLYPPTPSRLRQTAPRLVEIFRNCNANAVLTTSSVKGYMEMATAEFEGRDTLRWFSTDEVDSRAASLWRHPESLDGDSTAFLQYTSGSTGTPKGVMVTHQNLLSNTDMLRDAFDWNDTHVACHWVPIYHDLGLIGHTLAPLRYGIETYFMSPLDFLQRPLRWLKAISRFRGTMAAAPNFAYDLCVRRLREVGKVDLDLSSWMLAGNAAEPVSLATMDEFAEAFAPYGFRRGTFRPGYGLAEATVAVSMTADSAGPVSYSFVREELARNRAIETTVADANASILVACGTVAKPGTVMIVDPATAAPCTEAQVGEIWIRGDYVAAGYWRNEEETEAVFHAKLADGTGPFMRTGDLGVLRGERLIVTGRIKDLIIVRGTNHYPQDLERSAQQVPGIRRGGAAAFSIAVGDRQTEQVVVVVELDLRQLSGSTTAGADPAAQMTTILERVREELSSQHTIAAYDVCLVEAGTIPKTPSGKVQRRATRNLYMTEALPKLAALRT